MSYLSLLMSASICSSCNYRKYWTIKQIVKYNLIKTFSRTMEPSSSGLSYIEVKDKSNPIVLFNEWLMEARTYCESALFMNLATSAAKNGDVSNRTLVIRDVIEDGNLVFMVNANSRKVKDITDNPKVSACFLWVYSKDNKKIYRQVRVEGTVEKLSRAKCNFYYEKEPLHCKIRSHICPQGEKVDWDELKTKHDQLLKEVLENGKKLELPSYQVGYKILPNRMDFYYACGHYIADRVLFTKINGNEWKCDRIAT